jgi:hypothetical protein
MGDLGFKIVRTNGGDELLARVGNYEICKAAFEKAIFVYTKRGAGETTGTLSWPTNHTRPRPRGA